jgi:dTMP kinase
MFVVIEGIEGSGKSTLLLGLEERLRSDGLDPLVTREPGGTATGEAIREIFLNRSVAIAPLTEAFLVNAARAQHVTDVIRPALGAGRIVLCDRFTDSTLAYQGFGRGVDLGLLRVLCEGAAEGIKPDLVLVLDLPVRVARMRLRGRSTSMDRIEREREGFHERVRQGLIELAREPHHTLLDGTLSAGELLEKAAREVHEQRNVRVP